MNTEQKMVLAQGAYRISKIVQVGVSDALLMGGIYISHRKSPYNKTMCAIYWDAICCGSYRIHHGSCKESVHGRLIKPIFKTTHLKALR